MNKFEIQYQGMTEFPKKKAVADFLKELFEFLGIDKWELSVVFCNDPFIQDLNQKYRGKNEPTDVLSFSQNEEGKSIDFDKLEGFYAAGDIVIAVDQVEANSKEYSVPLNEEYKRLLIHGVLHLNGMKHISYSFEEDAMLKHQEEVLKIFADVKVVE